MGKAMTQGLKSLSKGITYADLLAKVESGEIEFDVNEEVLVLPKKVERKPKEFLTRHVGFEMTESMYNTLKAHADERGIPMAKVYREALNDFIHNKMKGGDEMQRED